jgi:hypothetical protein
MSKPRVETLGIGNVATNGALQGRHSNTDGQYAVVS